MKLVYQIGKQAVGGGHHFEIGRSVHLGGGLSGYASATIAAIAITPGSACRTARLMRRTRRPGSALARPARS